MARRLLLLNDQDDSRSQLRIQRKRVRDMADPFDLYEEEFKQIYRMPQNLVFILRDMAAPHMANTFISKEIRILVALSFLAEGMFLHNKVNIDC